MFTPRALIFLVLLGLFALPAHAAAPFAAGGYTLKVATDRADALYRRGDTVTFNVTLVRDATGEHVIGPEIKWSITKDGKPLNRAGTAKLEREAFILTGQLTEPGFLHCMVECMPPGAPKLTARAAAAFDPQEIQPSLPAPADFDDFWAAQKKHLAVVPANVRLTPVSHATEGIECFEVQADTGLGRPLSGYLARRAGAKPQSLPAIVIAHGSGVTTSNLTRAIAWAKDGFLALDFNAHGLPNAQPKEFYAALQAGELKEYYLQGRDSRDAMYLRGIFFRLLRAIDTL